MNYNPNLTRSMMEPLVLQLVAERKRYGYEIIRVVNERTNGAFEWKEGTLYPCLHRLEEEGLIRSAWEKAQTGRKRKYYGITRRGRAVLAEKSSEWSSFSTAVNAVLFSITGSTLPSGV
ncbi:helix-turn-helix transcriptional regulator [Lentisphaerota bacterium ZTH]|nr:helix-turn-helix transcriptional regulator [Lentisphaerota bacterium]WET06440.1 helix-turn-helix transcriptional regulator [Lentisphaerota bacterium ZTH]